MIKRVNRGRYHSYVDTDTGLKVPSVTTILDDGLPKKALIGWAANTTADYAVDHWDELGELTPSKRLEKLKRARYEDKDAAAKRGTEVHKLGERLVAGEEVDVPDTLAGHVESYVKFLDDFDVQPVVIEGICVNYTHRYAGTFDLIADFQIPKWAGIRWLLDIKTARSGVWPDNGLQLAAYRHAEWYRTDNETPEQPMLDVDASWVIHVRADGYSLIPVKTGPAVFRKFLYAQQIWDWSEDLSQTVVGEAVNPPAKETAA